MHRSALVIQKYGRRMLARKEAALRRVEQRQRAETLKAVRLLQRIYRRKKLMKQALFYSVCNRLYEVRRAASIMIQKVAKGMLVRQDMCFLKDIHKVIRWPHPAKTVSLLGSFTKRPWKDEIPMTYSKYAKFFWTDYLAKNYVSPGKCHNKFIVDGILKCDDELPVVHDQFGTFSNVIDTGKRYPQMSGFDMLGSGDYYKHWRKDDAEAKAMLDHLRTAPKKSEKRVKL